MIDTTVVNGTIEIEPDIDVSIAITKREMIAMTTIGSGIATIGAVSNPFNGSQASGFR